MSCVVSGCKNRKSININGITYHRFPPNETLKQKWIKALKKENWHPQKNSVVCSQHFQESDIRRWSPSKVFIKKTAVPSISKTNPKRLPTFEVVPGPSPGHNLFPRVPPAVPGGATQAQGPRQQPPAHGGPRLPPFLLLLLPPGAAAAGLRPQLPRTTGGLRPQEPETPKSKPEIVIPDIQPKHQELIEEDSDDINSETSFEIENKNDSDNKRVVIISDDADITSVLNCDSVDDDDANDNRMIIISDVTNDVGTCYEEDSDHSRASSPVLSNYIYVRTIVEQEKILKALKKKWKLTRQQARRQILIIKRLLKELSVVKHHIPKTQSNAKPIVHLLAKERVDQELAGENITNVKTRVDILLENNENQELAGGNGTCAKRVDTLLENSENLELSGKMNNITNFLDTFHKFS